MPGLKRGRQKVDKNRLLVDKKLTKGKSGNYEKRIFN
jgi:hypothetical protein